MMHLNKHRKQIMINYTKPFIIFPRKGLDRNAKMFSKIIIRSTGKKFTREKDLDFVN